MSASGSVTYWIDQLKVNDPDAAHHLWDRYFQRLVALARRRLGESPRQARDEEDVALSAFASICNGIERGRFPCLADRDDLWQLLQVITIRKSINQRKHEFRLKRRHREPTAALSDQPALEDIIGPDPTPEFVVSVAEECQRLLDRLGTEELRSVAIWKMEGDTTEDIAVKLKCAPRTIWRKLQLIRRTWELEVTS